MRIILDCDGVLADTITPTYKSLRRAGHDVCKAPSTFNFFSELTKEQAHRVRLLWSSKAFWARIKPVDGAVRAMKTLCEQGHEVFIATSIWDDCPAWVPTRLQWLTKHFAFNLANVIFIREKQLLKGDAFVDDCWGNCVKFAEANPTSSVYVLDAKYNAGNHPNIMRVHKWDTLLSELLFLGKQRRGQR